MTEPHSAEPSDTSVSAHDLTRRRIYLDGNSLGAPPTGVAARLHHVVEHEWSGALITAWNEHDWWNAPIVVGNRIARLIGAESDHVVVGDSTTIMLYKALGAAIEHAGPDATIVTESENFPTNRHVIDATAQRYGSAVLVRPRRALADELPPHSVVCASHVDFKFGHRLDLELMTRSCHDQHALTVWDLSHSAGAMPIDAVTANVDFAVGCTYKYLNGGPGAPAYLYVAPRHLADCTNPLPGWIGHDNPFAMEQTHTPSPGIRRMLSGTPSILAIAALDAALDAFDGIDLDELRHHSLELTDTCIEFAAQRLARFGVAVATPLHHAERGSQVSLTYPNAYALSRAAIAADVICDFREPDIVRLGFAPLATKRGDVDEAMQRIEHILEHAIDKEPRHSIRHTVT